MFFDEYGLINAPSLAEEGFDEYGLITPATLEAVERTQVFFDEYGLINAPSLTEEGFDEYCLINAGEAKTTLEAVARYFAKETTCAATTPTAPRWTRTSAGARESSSTATACASSTTARSGRWTCRTCRSAALLRGWLVAHDRNQGRT